ncbi:LysR family transcriptional regulator [Mycoavidus sp. B2-EB]|uniref:LysR family transcriptional regulator n=1 Tax=Mycoavidus sp. B2-EB TaxID=2651972 RepID=UPI001626655C|nr:LysR family transcriptional regulator [Mycoavidus sp. B2-EB]BBO60478.1 LysR family transcriptional regulator [Mycoavidus sp. B2-EB]
MIINQKRLRYFYAVHTNGKIRKAADYLDIDCSVITRQIALLEEEIGEKLFERHSRGMTLTEVGALLLDYYRYTQNAQQAFETGLQELRGMKRGAIRIVVLKAYGELLVESVLSDFCKEHSGLNISITETSTADQAVAEVIADEAHIGIMSHYSLNNQNIKYSVCASLPMCLVVSHKHPLAVQKKVTFSDAARYPLALPSPTSNLWHMIREAERLENIQLTPAFISDSISARKKFSSIDNGGTLMSALAAAQEIKTGQLVALEIDHQCFQAFQLCLVVKRNKPFLPAMNQLLRTLEAKLRVCAQTAKGLSAH